MVSQDILNYVKQQLAAGYDPNSIREALVSYGYPVRDVEDALEALTKPRPKPVQQVAKKPEEILRERGKETAPGERAEKVEELKILTLLRMWFLSLSMPKQIFYEAKNYASFHGALLNVSAAAIIGGLIGGAVFLARFFMNKSAGYAGTHIFGIGGLFTKVGTIERLFITPIEAILVWISITAFLHLFAAIAGGNGSFERFTYYTSIAYAPVILFVGFLQVLVPPCIVFFSYIAFGILGVYPTLTAIKDVNNLDTKKALIAIAIPMAIVALFLLPVILDIGNIFDAVCLTKPMPPFAGGAPL